MQQPVHRKHELKEVYIVRGAASLMVCFFHLVLGNTDLFPSTNLLERVCSYGFLGVEAFFVLSGYVICYSLPRDFTYQNLPTFFVKRIIRIEPPYLVSVILVLVLNWASHRITGLTDDVDALNLLGHIAYINNFTNVSTYVNVVYWTLGIEFQFYLLIGLIFPFMRRSKVITWVCLVTFLLLTFASIPSQMTVLLTFLSYFSLGIILYWFKIRKSMTWPLFLMATAIFGAQIFIYQGTPHVVAALSTVTILLFWNYSNRIIYFFSMVSFSLYLTHTTVGGKIINLGMRYVNTDLARYVLVLFALIASIGFAYVFYQLVEAPAFWMAKRISYKRLAADGQVVQETGKRPTLS